VCDEVHLSQPKNEARCGLGVDRGKGEDWLEDGVMTNVDSLSQLVVMGVVFAKCTVLLPLCAESIGSMYLKLSTTPRGSRPSG
jgi:hypothetical protein